MFIEQYDGLYYIGSDHKKYELLHGVTSNNYNSDIIFIFDRNDNHEPKVIDFVYGGFKHLQEDCIQAIIENYIKNLKEKGDR